MKRVLMIGNSACTLAAGMAYHRAGAEVCVYGQAANPNFSDIALSYETGALGDMDKIRAFAEKMRPDFCFIGPANPIADGAVDVLKKIGVPSVSPLQKAAVIETSKAFTRELMEKYGIPGSPEYRIFTSEDGMSDFVTHLEGQFVVKADGLMYGMGVKVSGDHFQTVEEGLEYAKECIAMHGRVVIEEKLVGEEFSLMSFCDGISTADMPAVQDFKRAQEGDQGPNTGGMGTYTDRDGLLPFVSRADYEAATDITRQIATAIRQELGIPFVGILFGGFMVTGHGLKVIEFNARAGDSEGVNTFTLLETSLLDISEAMLRGELAGMKVQFAPKVSVCKYVVPIGYPEKHQGGQPLEIGTLPTGVQLFTAWVERTPGGLVMAAPGGVVGRAIAVLGIADTLAEAEQLSEAGCQQITGPVYHRRDIASPESIAAKVRRMDMLRAK